MIPAEDRVVTVAAPGERVAVEVGAVGQEVVRFPRCWGDGLWRRRRDRRGVLSLAAPEERRKAINYERMLRKAQAQVTAADG